MSDSVPILHLKRDMERRVRGGHPWIFSNEIAQLPAGLVPGDLVELRDQKERPLGHGFWSRGSLIAVRMTGSGGGEPGSVDWFRERIRRAAARRAHLGRDTCRIVFAESDDLPGLIVDRYGDVLSVQCLTQGLERRRGELAAALGDLFAPRALHFDGSSSFRELEGLPRNREWWTPAGTGWNVTPAEELGADALQSVELDGLRLELDFRSVQKGGLFLDQVENWSRAAALGKGGAVLDICCYHGGWGLQAARAGATRVDFLDRSASALDRVTRNLELNDLADLPGERICATALDGIRGLLRHSRRYRLVVVDPPAFIKSKRHFAEGRQGYIDLNRMAMALVEDGGFLASCSCSHQMGVDNFREVLRLAAGRAGCRLRILGQLGQGQDHPQLPQVLETGYLKGFLLQVEREAHA